MKIITADGKSEFELLRQLRAANRETDRKAEETVRAIIENVREKGDAAVRKYTKEFDGAELAGFKLSKQKIDEACRSVPENIIKSLKKAADNILDFHKRQLHQSWLETKTDGVILGQRIRALDRVGIYVPGGRAAYPSSVLMNAIPAKAAGVREIVMVTPPGKNGEINPNILAAAKIAGVDEILSIGGAQAVAALAYGTESVKKVDKIVGPGNIYVATAKRLVFGQVDIDMIAGPSEILVIADETANPAYLAADLMSQAEHDPMAASTLICTSEEIVRRTLEEIKTQSAGLSRRNIIEESLNNRGSAIIVQSVAEAVRFANAVAPEHLELMVQNPMEWLGSVDNAGSVFLGAYAPEPLGDYLAGPNHVLPTGGTARFFSPLSVDAFIKKSSFIYYTKPALEGVGDDIITLAECEGLTAHANSIRVRLDK